MTPFMEWCEKNGYDPRGDFLHLPTHNICRISNDDNTIAPYFTRIKFPHLPDFAIQFEYSLTQHKTEPKMTEQKLPIPRMVEVRSSDATDWKQRELIADLSDFDVENPYVCRDSMIPLSLVNWKQMREIPQPKTRPMTPRELLDAIRGGAVWRYDDRDYARWDWNIEISIERVLLCYDWHGTDSDVWVKAEVTE